MDILGISFGVDTSACLLRDGQVIAAVLEERLSRVKHDRAWPSQAIAWCLSSGGTSLAGIDEVAFFWNPALQLDFAHPGRDWRYRHHGDYLHMVPAWLLGGMQAGLGGIRSDLTTQTIELEGRRPLVIRYVAHHLCHAATAFFPSPFERAAVLTADGYGEREATTLGCFDGDSWRRIESLRYPDSLGAFYAAITSWLGFRTNSGEGKVMGLAPYGDDRYVERFREILGLGVDPARPYSVDLSWFEYFLDTPRRVSDRFLSEFGPPAVAGRPFTEEQKAVAFAAQAVTEEAMLALARRLHDLSGQRNLAMAGGVLMNSCASGRIEREGPFERVWVQPAAGDGGTAVGAALWAWHQVHGRAERHRWRHDFLGPGYSDDECRAALRRSGWRWTEPADLYRDTAEAVARGDLVGWFRGRSELGARALGNRSIVADPRRPENKDVLNQRVKFREPFRPFAPSVLLERAHELFEMPEGASVPFMQKVHPVRPQWRERLGAVTHVDGTGRLQTVDREAAPAWHALIAAFGEITGVPVVLNTSFNVRGEPIVQTPDDAIRCWASTGLDRLVLGPCVATKG